VYAATVSMMVTRVEMNKSDTRVIGIMIPVEVIGSSKVCCVHLSGRCGSAS
jgi:hypothetical protein